MIGLLVVSAVVCITYAVVGIYFFAHLREKGRRKVDSWGDQVRAGDPSIKWTNDEAAMAGILWPWHAVRGLQSGWQKLVARFEAEDADEDRE
jgi:hypothetical protein